VPVPYGQQLQGDGKDIYTLEALVRIVGLPGGSSSRTWPRGSRSGRHASRGFVANKVSEALFADWKKGGAKYRPRRPLNNAHRRPPASL
jgi:hypothetical protein